MAAYRIEQDPKRGLALRLRTEEGYTVKALAKLFGITERRARDLSATAEKLEMERQASRAYKQNLTDNSKCIDCGGKTSYAGVQGRRISIRCRKCAAIYGRSTRKWTTEAVVDAIRRFHAANGRPPTATEWINADPGKGYPPRSAVYGPRSEFPKWSDAIKAAGYLPYRDMSRIDYGLLLERLSEKWTYSMIAEEQGCSAAGVGFAVKKMRKDGIL